MSDDEKDPTSEELAAAAQLREALDDDPIAKALKAAWSPAPIDAQAHAQMIDDLPTDDELRLAGLIDEDEMVLALKAAWNPQEIAASEHRAMVDRATAGAVVTLRPRTNRLRVAVITTTTVFALAAGFILLVQTQKPPAEAPLALAKARSTQPLFGEPFKEGETSARIDRIALARASDYRDNYFAKRGVR